MTYITAGTQPWTVKVFDRLRGLVPADWTHVQTPAALFDACAETLPRAVFVLHWHWWIPSLLWKPVEMINLHAAPLPWGRGGNIIEHQLQLGRTETMLTAHRVTDVLDGGPIYGTRGPISLAGTRDEILDRFVAPAVDLITWIIRTEPEPVPQTGEVVTFKRLSPEAFEQFWQGRKEATS